MSLLFVRIDDRLIHGQVIEGWCRSLEINHIVVCNDAVAGDEMQKALLSLAVPPSIRISILTIDEMCGVFSSEDFKKDRVLVLLSSPKDALRLIKKGFPIKSINVGGLHYTIGKIQVHKAISLSDEDLDDFEELDKFGVELEVRLIPTDQKINMN